MKYPLKLLALIALLGLVPVKAAMADVPGPVPPDVAPPQITSCTGGAQEAINGFTRNFPAVFAAGVIPNTIVNGGASVGGGPSRDDLYVVTFSAEADAAVAASGWTAQAQFSVDGGATFNPMPPVGPNTFHQGDRQETHTMTWCRRIASQNPVLFRIVAAGFGTPVIVDDYTTLVERSD